jgi:flagellar biosynthetic protein FlhB
MAEDFERTEPATPRRREEARKKGHVPQSGDLPLGLLLGFGLLGLWFLGSRIFQALSEFMSLSLFNLTSLEPEKTLEEVFSLTLKLLSPFFLIVVFGAVFGNVITKGFVLSLEPLKGGFSRLNPVEGLRRMFSFTALFELGKSLVKVALLGVVGFLVLKGRLWESLNFLDLDLIQIGSNLKIWAFDLLWKMGLVILGISVLEVPYHLWTYERRLRMTREELKEELKQYEGDPRVKARIRSFHRKFVKHRMIQRVKEADVVVTNPVHLAVALMYKPGQSKAPVVVAKGKGWLAEKIREEAVKACVPIYPNPHLAQVLYKTVEVGQTIPVELYRAVAEVLAWAYRLKR